MSSNYFNSLPLRLQLDELGRCRFMDGSEFNGVEALKGKKIVIIGCGAQGLNQGLNLRDSGLDVSYTLREAAISEQRQSWKNATENDFKVGTYEEMLPDADLVINLTPDKQHSNVIETVMPFMKKDSCLSYSHGFNIVEEGMQIRDDITVVMVAPPSLREPRFVRSTSVVSGFPPCWPCMVPMIPRVLAGILPRPMPPEPVVTAPVALSLLS